MLPLPADSPASLPPRSPAGSPPAGGTDKAPQPLDLARLQAALAPYDHLARLRNALINHVGLPGLTTITVHVQGNAARVWIQRVQIRRGSRSLDDTPAWTPAIAAGLLLTLHTVDAEFAVFQRHVARWVVEDKEAWTARLIITIADGVPNPEYEVQEPEPLAGLVE